LKKNAVLALRHAASISATAFDLIEQDGDDLRDLPLIERKRRIKKLLGSGSWGRAASHLVITARR